MSEQVPTFKEWAQEAIADLRKKYQGLIRRCPRCGVRFFRNGKQEYCSKECGARARAARHYANNRSVVLRRRAERYREKNGASPDQE